MLAGTQSKEIFITTGVTLEDAVNNVVLIDQVTIDTTSTEISWAVIVPQEVLDALYPGVELVGNEILQYFYQVMCTYIADQSSGGQVNYVSWTIDDGEAGIYNNIPDTKVVVYDPTYYDGMKGTFYLEGGDGSLEALENAENLPFIISADPPPASDVTLTLAVAFDEESYSVTFDEAALTF